MQLSKGDLYEDYIKLQSDPDTQLKRVQRRAEMSLILYRRLHGKTWGLRLSMMYWIHNGGETHDNLCISGLVATCKNLYVSPLQMY